MHIQHNTRGYTRICIYISTHISHSNTCTCIQIHINERNVCMQTHMTTYGCIYTHTYIRVRVYTYTHTRTRTPVHMRHAKMCVRMCVFLFFCESVVTPTLCGMSMCVCMSLWYVSVGIHVCTYARVHDYVRVYVR